MNKSGNELLREETEKRLALHDRAQALGVTPERYVLLARATDADFTAEQAVGFGAYLELALQARRRGCTTALITAAYVRGGLDALQQLALDPRA